MKPFFLVLPVLLGATSVAQATTPMPTQQQAVAADTRVGSTFSFEGAQIFYQVTGTGTPLVLIHGYPLSGALFTYQQTGLASRFQVITLDLPGYGQSTATSGSASTAYYAQVVLALLNHLGIAKAVIGGHSMGGTVTEELYREAPQVFAGMILIDTVAAAAPTVEKAQWIGYELQATEQGVPSVLPNIVPTLLTGNTLLDTPVVGTQISDIIAEASVEGLQAGATTLVDRPDYTSLLPTIAVPTLVLEGVDDGVYAFPVAQQIQAAIKGSTLALLPNGGHVAVFERPNETNQAIAAWATASGF